MHYFMVSFISALGYGFGETIARLSGWSMFMCTVASTVLGIVLEEFISNIVFSKAVQKSKERRIVTFAGIFLFFSRGSVGFYPLDGLVHDGVCA
ncbi:hypothetical protein [Oribacterium sp. WCC10]|uniref:hypothetical protein n=1 Tax=Oribacterium sp. WCC10 TaxID=1855343 RepID=UPI0008F0A739|nr:hypothetical protein [Oribacterium sp. WCC10]SFG67605.1 hypothetical protein SAMN05216356_11855 [Oribacterium sp. WCC10]